MSQVDVDSGIENMEVDENDRREKRILGDKVGDESWALGFRGAAGAAGSRSMQRPQAPQAAGPCRGWKRSHPRLQVPRVSSSWRG